MSVASRIRSALQTGRRMAPSQHDAWHGTPESGSMWTREQLARIAAEGKSLDRLAVCTVGVQIQNQSDWAMPPQTKRILCPMLTKTRSGKRALIITPAGDKIWKDIL